MSGGVHVQYLEQEMDVGRLARVCGRFLRDKVSFLSCLIGYYCTASVFVYASVLNGFCHSLSLIRSPPLHKFAVLNICPL